MQKNNNDFLKSYIPAQLYTGKSWYIGYYVLHPKTNKLKRVRIKLNRIKNLSERKKYANQLIKKINKKLENGWNPYIENNKEFQKLTDCISKFILEYEKKLKSGIIRKYTFFNYKSHLENFEQYIIKHYSDDITINDITRKTLHEFLDYKFMQNNIKAITRDNYLSSLKVFYAYLTDKQILKTNIAYDIKKYGKRMSGKKHRKRIRPEHLKLINDYLQKHDKYFLFACKFMYYTLMRSSEMAGLKLENISIEKKLIVLPKEISKNKKTRFVTIPDKLHKLMIELKIYDYPADYYLFSDKFMPGLNKKTDKKFRDKFRPLRKKLGLPDTYVFYSLKDTGISNMIKRVGLIATRDQAGHHSVEITNRYVEQEYDTANRDIINMDLDF